MPSGLRYCPVNEGETAMLNSQDIIRKLEADGWYFVGAKGSHWQFRHPSRPGKVTVVHPRKDNPIKTIRSMEKQSGTKLI